MIGVVLTAKKRNKAGEEDRDECVGRSGMSSLISSHLTRNLNEMKENTMCVPREKTV